MAKKSRKMNLAPKHLALVAAFLKVVNELLDLLSKVVNYASCFWKLRVQVPQ